MLNHWSSVNSDDHLVVPSLSTNLSPLTDGFSLEDTVTFFPNAMLVFFDTSAPFTVIVEDAIADVMYPSFTAIAFTVDVLDTGIMPS